MSASLTPDEIRTARLMRRESKTIEHIARHLGRSRALVSDACRDIARGTQQRAQVVTIPPSVLAERDHRLAMGPRDLTAAITGDPLPGMSALERREKSAAAYRSLSASS